VGAARTLGGLERCVVEVDFLEDAATRRRAPLGVCWDVAFERVPPVRGFDWSRGQGHFPGWWWSATTGDHVGYESWLERDHVMLLDYDRDVVGYASQPFWLHWPGTKRGRRHAPDFFARRRDGSGMVIDVRADDRIEAADAEAFEVTARACAEVGWVFRRVGVVDAVLAANLRWLSRYRHPRHGARTEVVEGLLQVFAEPTALFAGVARVGDRIGVLPVLFHLLWRQDVVADLAAAPLAASTIVVRRAWGAAR
jgi:hypothetical protein